VQAATVGWALTVSGVMSALSFALVMTVGAAVSGNSTAVAIGLAGAALNALPVLLLLAALRVRWIRRALVRVVTAVLRLSSRLIHRPKGDPSAAIEELLDRVGEVRATMRQYTAAFVLSLRNWLADCVCLAFAIKASGAAIPWHGLLLAYCLAVTAGSAGLTPGGLGVVEVALTAGLVGAGLSARHAVAAVLVYRLISLWLVVGIGWLLAARLSRRGRAPEAQTETETGTQ
jgi:uncharacterized protein (TIRG00374 family)